MVEPWTEQAAVLPHQHIFEAATLPTKNVIVYCDRAEVKRLVSVSLAKGTNEIVVQNVSAVIERQSVRVDGRGVHIQEVQYQEMPVDSEIESERVRQLEKDKIELESQRLCLEDEISSLAKRIEVLDGVAGQIAAGPTSSAAGPSTTTPHCNSQPNLSRRHTVTGPTAVGSVGGGGSVLGHSSIGFLMNEEALGNLEKFLNYYGSTTSDMKRTMRTRQRDREHLLEQIDGLERQIDQLRCGCEYDSIKRNITIIVEMDAAAHVELFVSYQVYCVSWKPAYDVRASTVTEEGQKNTIKLCYYGLVEQNTGDDWKDTELVLSTASPSVGGSAPQLATLAATIHRPSRYQRQRQASAARRKQPLSATSEEDMGFGSFDYNEMVDAVALHRYNTGQLSRSSEENSVSSPLVELLATTPPIPVLEQSRTICRVLPSKSVENLISTCFSIPRSVTIPSNGVEHKVLVAMVDLDCAYWHESVPSRCAAAFLSATVTNTSSFCLLPGAAAVYLNNSFVSKTHLKAVAPGEEFRCSLGMDPSIKVEYKSPICCHEQVGFMSKSTLVTHEQIISLRNAKVGQAVQVTVKEQIPKSADEKIKVSIVYPDLRSKTGEARLNKDHNLEWTIILAAGQAKDLHVKYTVEHPASESVSYRLVA